MCADIELRLGRSLPANFAETLRARVAAVFDTELVPIAGVEAVLDGIAVPPLRRLQQRAWSVCAIRCR